MMRSKKVRRTTVGIVMAVLVVALSVAVSARTTTLTVGVRWGAPPRVHGREGGV